jgi:hypothetical protein
MDEKHHVLQNMSVKTLRVDPLREKVFNKLRTLQLRARRQRAHARGNSRANDLLRKPE